MSALPAPLPIPPEASATREAVVSDHEHVGLMVRLALALFRHGRSFEARHEARRDLAAILHGRLPRGERQSLAWSALTACDEDDALGVIEDLLPALEPDHGAPTIPLDAETLAADAQMWAAGASRREQLAYALAVLDVVSPRDRAALQAAALDAVPFAERLARLTRRRARRGMRR